jgi:hypothetical protein
MQTERRKNPRLGLAIPLRVQGFRADGTTWEEITTTLDVSAGGACFPLGQEADLGQVFLLLLALPKRLRQFDYDEESYRVYSIVRGVRRVTDPPRIGVMFFGQHPPRGFQERPAARYLLPTDPLAGAPAPQGLRPEDAPSPETLVGVPPPPVAGAPFPEFHRPNEEPPDRRATPRVEIFVNFTIQQVDEWGAVLQEELTVADNIARVMTSLGFHVGDVLLLQEAGGSFATRAEVRGTSRVQATVDRLHLRFLDRLTPDRLLRQ